MQTPRASLLSIGTEVTSGQIINTNASRLAARLTELGFEVTLHIAVADDEPAMLAAFDYAARASTWMILTGGLGPTSDDMTREIIAKWAGQELEWNETAWQHVVHRLQSRGRDARDIHRKQAQFPVGSIVLSNREGSACGFILEIPVQQKILIVLPGPPKEIEAIWNDHVDQYILPRIPDKQVFLYTWLCQGRGESEFAEMAEEIFHESRLRLGYRLVDRQVEVKVWVPREREQESNALRNRLTEKLKPYLISQAGPL